MTRKPTYAANSADHGNQGEPDRDHDKPCAAACQPASDAMLVMTFLPINPVHEFTLQTCVLGRRLYIRDLYR